MTTLTHLTSGGESACSVAAPVPSLAPQLRALGGFDQPYDAGDVAQLQALATQAAAVSAPRLIGTVPGRPVAVAALLQGEPDALVLPLTYAAGTANAGRVAGLVDFLRDCTGRAYYGTIDDLSASVAAAPAGFPQVTQAQAARRLQTATPQLVYGSTPFAPAWRNPATGQMLAAGA